MFSPIPTVIQSSAFAAAETTIDSGNIAVVLGAGG
jgi:hypothetical protein